VGKILKLRLKFELLASRPFSDFQQRALSRSKILYELVRRKIIPLNSMNLEKIIKKFEKIKQNKTKSPWGSYHDEIKEKAKRFERIIEIINNLGDDVRSVVDLGGNQGKLCRLLVQKTNLDKSVCIDCDENAIDEGYNREKKTNNQKISFAHYDFMGPTVKLRFMLPNERFKSDVAIALALTHHLILSQGYDINDIFKNISAYAHKYVFIEFIPKGLWPAEQKPPIPDWYTREWFRESFIKFFELVLEEDLRENNVLFVGKVRTDS
jgi:hypothetical protein